jgi:hypothetical protein
MPRRWGHLDQRHTPQYFPWIAPLVALVAVALDQSLGFIKVQRRDRHAAAGGQLADAELLMDILRGDHLKNAP